VFIDVDVRRNLDGRVIFKVESDAAAIVIMLVIATRSVDNPGLVRPHKLIVFMPPTDTAESAFQIAENITSGILQAGVTPHASAIVRVRPTMVRGLNTTGNAIDNGIARAAAASANIGAIVAAIDRVDVDVDRAMIASVDVDVDVGISKSGDGSETDGQDEDEREDAFHIVFLLSSNVRQLLPKLASVTYLFGARVTILYYLRRSCQP